PALAWSAGLLAALALAPPLSRSVVARFERGAALAPARAGAAALTLATAVVVWAWPDRVHFVGDFLLREGTAERALRPAGLFPQALPLDVFLHYGVPRGMADAFGVPVAITERAQGALEAALLAVLAVAFARALHLRGARAAATVAITLLGGFLGI